ncbi:MAG: hypothetical protein KJ647_05155, partial [Candidatus Omnitrophica bacterium]|nr:hypothetical protein [Candidatus Omnitrophota bacterium]
MLSKFFKKKYRKSLAAIMVVSSLWLGYDTFAIWLESTQANNLIYASDNLTKTSGFIFAEAEASLSLLEKEKSSLKEQLLRAENNLKYTELKLNNQIVFLGKEKSSLKEQLLQTEDNFKKTEALLNDQLTALTKSKQEAEAKLNDQLTALTKSKQEAEASLSLLEKEASSLKEQL